jgi:cardiolipin synthase
MNHRSPLINTAHPIAKLVKRLLLLTFGLPFVIAIVVSLIDSYRTRGKKPKPFSTLPATRTPIGDEAVTTYSFGQDLYSDMLAAIDAATHEILLETYIWKDDHVGEQFKSALTRAADRGVTVKVIYDKFANLVVGPEIQGLPPEHFCDCLSALQRRLALLRCAQLRAGPPQGLGC